MKVSENYYDEIFDFKGQWDMPSQCGLRIRDFEGKKVVITTELYQDNPGTSITYAGGNLVQQICAAKGFKYQDIIYIECNPNTNSKLSFYDEEFFQVTFQEENGALTKPSYKQLSSDYMKQLLNFK